jgi:hypothetical protein
VASVPARLAFAGPVCSLGRSLAHDVFPAPPWVGTIARTHHYHLSWTYPLPQRLLLVSCRPSVDRASSEDILRAPLMGLIGPYSTSSKRDLPTRVSTPAEFRLRRFCDLDGLLPLSPCWLISSSGTHGVPGFRLLSSCRSRNCWLLVGSQRSTQLERCICGQSARRPPATWDPKVLGGQSPRSCGSCCARVRRPGCRVSSEEPTREVAGAAVWNRVRRLETV